MPEALLVLAVAAVAVGVLGVAVGMLVATPLTRWMDRQEESDGDR